MVIVPAPADVNTAVAVRRPTADQLLEPAAENTDAFVLRPVAASAPVPELAHTVATVRRPTHDAVPVPLALSATLTVRRPTHAADPLPLSDATDVFVDRPTQVAAPVPLADSALVFVERPTQDAAPTPLALATDVFVFRPTHDAAPTPAAVRTAALLTVTIRSRWMSGLNGCDRPRRAIRCYLLAAQHARPCVKHPLANRVRVLKADALRNRLMHRGAHGVLDRFRARLVRAPRAGHRKGAGHNLWLDGRRRRCRESPRHHRAGDERQDDRYNNPHHDG
jgi:hypothetical protein